MTWQPTSFQRFERSHSTSVGTARIITDAGPAYIKPLGNRSGPHVLACEWVGSQLARWFGLPIPDFALMQVDAGVDEIPLGGRKKAASGPAFVSRAMPGAHTWGGSADELQAIVNPEAIPRLVVFDTWTLNADRYPPDLETRKPNWDNVLLCSEAEEPGRFRLFAIDHTHCFTGGGDLTRHVAGIRRAKDERVYGLFPPFQRYITKADVERAVHKLGEVQQDSVRSIVSTIPDEWEVAREARDALSDLITQRAAFVAGRIGQSLAPFYPQKQRELQWKKEETDEPH